VTRGSLLPLIAVNFLSSLGFSIVMPFLVFLVAGMGGNAFVMGVIGAAYSACQLVGAPWLGGLSDRVGRKRVLLYSQLGGLIAWVIFAIALVVPHVVMFTLDNSVTGHVIVILPIVLIVVSRSTDGLINGSISVANAYLADATPAEERKTNFARLGAASSLGFVIGPVAAGYIARDQTGVMWLVLLAMALSVGGAIVVWRLLPDIPLTPAKVADVSSPAHKALGGGAKECVVPHEGSLATLFAVPRTKRMIALYFLVYLGFSIFTTVLPMHALVDLGWSSGKLGSLFGVLALSLITTQALILPKLSRRSTDQTLGAIGCVQVAASYLLVAFGGTSGAFISAALYGIGNGLMWPSYLAMLSGTGPANMRGRLQGVASSSGSVASIVGMLGGGSAFGVLGPKTFLVAAAALGVAAVIFVIDRATAPTSD
jgi:MFS transporter, DHA1 family, tetracycline resistance protein